MNNLSCWWMILSKSIQEMSSSHDQCRYCCCISSPERFFYPPDFCSSKCVAYWTEFDCAKMPDLLWGCGDLKNEFAFMEQNGTKLVLKFNLKYFYITWWNSVALTVLSQHQWPPRGSAIVLSDAPLAAISPPAWQLQLQLICVSSELRIH